MRYWRLFIFVLAVSGPVSSYAQRALIGLRQQCVKNSRGSELPPDVPYCQRQDPRRISRDHVERLIRNDGLSHNTERNLERESSRSRDLTRSIKREIKGSGPEFHSKHETTRGLIREASGSLDVRADRVQSRNSRGIQDLLVSRESRSEVRNRRTLSVNGEERRLTRATTRFSELSNDKNMWDRTEFRDYSRNNRADSARPSNERLYRDETFRGQQYSRRQADHLSFRRGTESNLRETHSTPEEQTTQRYRESLSDIRNVRQEGISRERDSTELNTRYRTEMRSERRFSLRGIVEKHNGRENVGNKQNTSTDFRRTVRLDRLEVRSIGGDDVRASVTNEKSGRVESHDTRNKEMVHSTRTLIRTDERRHIEYRRDSKNRDTREHARDQIRDTSRIADRRTERRFSLRDIVEKDNGRDNVRNKRNPSTDFRRTVRIDRLEVRSLGDDDMRASVTREERGRPESHDTRNREMVYSTRSLIRTDERRHFEYRNDFKNRDSREHERDQHRDTLRVADRRTDVRRVRESSDSRIQSNRHVLETGRDISGARKNQIDARERYEGVRLSRFRDATENIRTVNNERLPADNNFRYRREISIKRERLDPDKERILLARSDNTPYSKPSNSYKAQSEFSDEWKTAVFHALQGIYLCGVIMQIAGGSDKQNKFKLAGWLPLTQHSSIKLD